MNVYRKSKKLVDFKTRTHGVINCAKFSHDKSNYIIAGDSKNYTHIFSTSSSAPLFSFGGQNPGENTDYVTSVEFWENSKMAFSGTFRGAITILDLETKKSKLISNVSVTAKLMGHTTQVTCMVSMANEEINRDILVSGSCDTTVKVWDINDKMCILNLKGHRAQVNDVRISPDGGWIASCGNDKRTIIWDIKNASIVKEFDFHNAPLNAIAFNPQELSIAAAGVERNATYYSLEGAGTKILGKTANESSPIECITFDDEGVFLFTAGQDSLKVWNIDGTSKLAGTFEVKWKGVQDLKMSASNTQLYGISASSNEFSLWVTEWNSSSPISPPTYENAVMHHNQNIYNVKKITAPTPHPVKNVLKTKPLDPSGFRQVESDLRASKEPTSHLLSSEMVNKIRKEHKKFSDLMKDKQNYLKPIIHWLNTGKILAAVNAIEKLDDASVIMDLINMMLNTKKTKGISIDFATTLIKKARILVGSNYMIHIRIGLKFVIECISEFSKEIISAKGIKMMSKVDLAREQRIKKMDDFLLQLKEISKSKRLKKIRDRYASEEVGKLCKVCLNDIEFTSKVQIILFIN